MICKYLILMVGTGRFELPNGSALPNSPSQAALMRLRGRCGAGWGASRVGLEDLRRMKGIGKTEMVGTGRFELPNGSALPNSPSQAALMRLRGRCGAGWGASRVGLEDLRRMKGIGKTEMVGTGRFELPTPRTPSECSTRLSHVPTQDKPVRRGEPVLGSPLVYNATWGLASQPTPSGQQRVDPECGFLFLGWKRLPRSHPKPGHSGRPAIGNGKINMATPPGNRCVMKELNGNSLRFLASARICSI